LYASLHPQQIGKLIAMAPYTEPMKSQNDWILSQIWYTRQVQPWNTATDDELYAYFFKQIVYSTYPSVEPIVLENPFKLEAIFRMGLGIRKFQAVNVVASLPPKSLHLMIAGRDRYIPRDMLEGFWAQVPASAQATKLIVSNSGHKIPEDVPRFAASWVIEILKDTPPVRQNSSFEADAYTGVVKFSGGEIQLTKEY
ncbi:MAG: alpha/beta fold hydrolase, partial [Pseudobdellovibrionaceae bacterium]